MKNENIKVWIQELSTGKNKPFPPLHHNLYKSGHAREQLKTKI